ncbi:hypothetical protein SDC9_97765 [bioreactor metagenome]|uniref:Uncharacterized protein n=1 Tax=bioreactor metagenome TaxID=1076179 RepID=A0A645ACV7_9ZZZZ
MGLRPFQYAITKPKQALGYRRIGQQKKGKHIDLRVPKIMALITFTAQALGRNVAQAVLPRALQQLIQAKIHAVLQGFVP